MKQSTEYDICSVTDASHDTDLVRQIANIEALIQPHDAWSQDSIASLLSQDSNHCWAVIEGSLKANVGDENEIKVVAYCLYSTVFETAEILRIGTHPKYQRQGLATCLLKPLIKHMPNKELERILLEVRADNHAAIALYKKMGFELIHTRIAYYSSPVCDALIMAYQDTNND
ncbi:ribosomal protein S18-alanine N-acetyltransferase [Psychrobacter sp. FDAARGOS_221]|uniref:ribosomal protein S18-alanine N-acetyltransferase n=1 Tax=Psychrobacter sp. FDAARGOS_221 TaxID=1975705 RepID=UPI001D0D250E|nr:ribosomal protein S18-alanine N-acetyltransferase [Psychrobacter sp. FDAARGOS_221]